MAGLSGVILLGVCVDNSALVIRIALNFSP